MQGATPSSYSYDNTKIVCFAEGTLIATPDGTALIESLRSGDMVITREAGPQRILWMGVDHLDQFDLGKDEALQPILIPRGALGAQRGLFYLASVGFCLGKRRLRGLATLSTVCLACGLRVASTSSLITICCSIITSPSLR